MVIFQLNDNAPLDYALFYTTDSDSLVICTHFTAFLCYCIWLVFAHTLAFDRMQRIYVPIYGEYLCFVSFICEISYFTMFWNWTLKNAGSFPIRLQIFFKYLLFCWCCCCEKKESKLSSMNHTRVASMAQLIWLLKHMPTDLWLLSYINILCQYHILHRELI